MPRCLGFVVFSAFLELFGLFPQVANYWSSYFKYRYVCVWSGHVGAIEGYRFMVLLEGAA